MLKKLSIVMMVGIANLILMTGVFAGDAVKISVEAEKANGDELLVEVSGSIVGQLTGMARLSCGAGDECLTVLTGSYLGGDPYYCEIGLHGPGGSTYVTIDICGSSDPTQNDVPNVSVYDEYGNDLAECPEPTCDHEQFALVRDKLEIEISVVPD